MTNTTRITLQDIAQSVGAPLDQVTKVILGQPDVEENLRHQVFAALEAAGLVHISRESALGTFGIVYPGTLIGDYVGAVVQGISETAKSRGYSALLYSEHSAKEQELIHMLEAGSCDGIILVVPNHYQRLLEFCRQYHREYVLVDYQGDDEMNDALTVEAKNRQSVVEVTNHLIDLGHRRIAFITGRMAHASARQRHQGYKDALEAAGIAYDPALVGEGNWFHEGGYQQTQILLDLDEPPSAIVASNDLEAFGAMQAARERGLEIGAELSITGFDDIEMASTVTPPLTTVRQPMFELGEAAVDLLIKRLNGEPLPTQRVQLDTELIIRQSTGPLSD